MKRVEEKVISRVGNTLSLFVMVLAVLAALYYLVLPAYAFLQASWSHVAHEWKQLRSGPWLLGGGAHAGLKNGLFFVWELGLGFAQVIVLYIGMMLPVCLADLESPIDKDDRRLVSWAQIPFLIGSVALFVYFQVYAMDGVSQFAELMHSDWRGLIIYSVVKCCECVAGTDAAIVVSSRMVDRLPRPEVARVCRSAGRALHVDMVAVRQLRKAIEQAVNRLGRVKGARGRFSSLKVIGIEDIGSFVLQHEVTGTGLKKGRVTVFIRTIRFSKPLMTPVDAWWDDAQPLADEIRKVLSGN